MILDLSAGCIPETASRFPAATRMKSHGTGSLLTIAPELRSLCPRMLNSPSWRAVSRLCWLSILSMLISSMNRTPLFALWMAPGSSLSWAGVSRPPLWNGSCLTSPRSAPACAPVASMNGGGSSGLWVMSSLGTRMDSFLWPLYPQEHRTSSGHQSCRSGSKIGLLYMIAMTTDRPMNMTRSITTHEFF